MKRVSRAVRRIAMLAALGCAVVLTSGSLVSRTVFYADPVHPVADGAYRRCLWDSGTGALYRASDDAAPICETVVFKRGSGAYAATRLIGPDEPGAVLSSYRDEWRLFATPEEDGAGQFIVFHKYEGDPDFWSVNRLSMPGPDGYDFVMSDDRCHRMSDAARAFMQKKGAIAAIDRSRGENRDRCLVREAPDALSAIHDASDAWTGKPRYAWVFYARSGDR